MSPHLKNKKLLEAKSKYMNKELFKKLNTPNISFTSAVFEERKFNAIDSWLL
jgi:hypothetical protein